MATGDPMMNGEVPHNPGMLEETLHQMNILIQENRDLKGKCERVQLFPLSAKHSLHLFKFNMCPLRRVPASDQPDDEGAL